VVTAAAAAVAARRAAHVLPRHPRAIVLVLAALLVCACLVSLNLGAIGIAPLDVVKTLAGQGSERDHIVLFEFRLPRLVFAALVGVALATAGAILQGVTQNVLADPGILGINACAGLAVFTLMVASGYASGSERDYPVWRLPLAALVGGVVGAALIYLLAYKRGAVTPSRLLIVGVAIAFGASSALPIMATQFPAWFYQSVIHWLEGSTVGIDWEEIVALLPWVAVLSSLAFYRARTLDALNLGDQISTGLGVHVERQRLAFVGMAVGLASSSVALAGGIAFVGLIGPHIGRRLVGPTHRALFPAAALTGALLVVVADIIARTALEPFEIPVGIVVAVIGAPYFLYLLARTKG
jgi:iron complex transport system permease protein